MLELTPKAQTVRDNCGRCGRFFANPIAFDFDSGLWEVMEDCCPRCKDQKRGE